MTQRELKDEWFTKQIDKFIEDYFGEEFYVTNRFSNGLSLNLTKSTFDKIIEDERIEKIDLPKTGKIYFAETKPLIGLTELFSSIPYYGDDVKVCVIDTGIYSDYLDLYQNIKNQSCFCSISDYGLGGCCSNLKNESDNAYESVKIHGTYVSGLIASDLSENKGIAPHVDLYVVKAVNSEGNYDNIDIGKAIKQCTDWDVNIITMSLGDNEEYSSGDSSCGDVNMDYELNWSYFLNITMFAASGNNAYDEGISYPACSPYVISVGATYDWGDGTEEVDWCEKMGGERNIFGNCNLEQYDCKDNPYVDNVACWGNKGDNLDLLASGSNVTYSKVGGGTFSDAHGTSASTPVVAGVAALLLDKNSSLNPSQILGILSSTGEPIWDSRSQSYYQKINISKAINSICTCSDWQQQSCGYSICDDGEMGYTRTCDGETCGNELDCVPDYSNCGGTPSGVMDCNPNYCSGDYSDDGVGN